MESKEIQQYWEEEGQNLIKGDIAYSPTSRDPYMGELERENVLRHLRADQDVLEIGCGDGIHSIEYAQIPKKYMGIDIAPSLIEVAKKRAKENGIVPSLFSVGSILEDLENLTGKTFDAIISQRCLINIPHWEDQKRALKRIHAMLKPGGLLLMSEGFLDELATLNELRNQNNQAEIKVVGFNNFFQNKNFFDFIDPLFELHVKGDYGLYMFLTRVFHPLLVAPDQPQHTSKVNKTAKDMVATVSSEPFEKYSYNCFYALRKAPTA